MKSCAKLLRSYQVNRLVNVPCTAFIENSVGNSANAFACVLKNFSDKFRSAIGKDGGKSTRVCGKNVDKIVCDD